MITPCVKVCKLNKNVCIGCGRTKEEIIIWSKLNNSERKQIMKKLKKLK